MNPAGDNTLEAVGGGKGQQQCGLLSIGLCTNPTLALAHCCWPAFAGQFLSDYAFWALETAVAIAWRRDMKPRHCSER